MSPISCSFAGISNYAAGKNCLTIPGRIHPALLRSRRLNLGLAGIVPTYGFGSPYEYGYGNEQDFHMELPQGSGYNWNSANNLGTMQSRGATQQASKGANSGQGPYSTSKSVYSQFIPIRIFSIPSTKVNMNLDEQESAQIPPSIPNKILIRVPLEEDDYSHANSDYGHSTNSVRIASQGLATPNEYAAGSSVISGDGIWKKTANGELLAPAVGKSTSQRMQTQDGLVTSDELVISHGGKFPSISKTFNNRVYY